MFLFGHHGLRHFGREIGMGFAYTRGGVVDQLRLGRARLSRYGGLVSLYYYFLFGHVIDWNCRRELGWEVVAFLVLKLKLIDIPPRHKRLQPGFISFIKTGVLRSSGCF